MFTTSFDNQTSLRIVVLQGEHTEAADNQVLAEFTFSGIRPAPAGQVDIEITFDIDADGIVNVTARDLETRKEHNVTVSRSSNLTSEEIERMSKENADYLVSEKQNEEARNVASRIKLLKQQISDLLDKKEDLPEAITGYAKTLLKRADDALDNPNDLHYIKNVANDLEGAVTLIKNS